jgi:hypothetical protein
MGTGSGPGPKVEPAATALSPRGAGSGPDWNSLNLSARRRGRGRTLVLVIGIVVVVAVAASIGVYAAGVLTPKKPCNPTIPSPWNTGDWAVLAKCGSQIVVPAHSFYGYDAERFSDAQVLLGEFTSADSLGVYLLNQSLFTAVTAQSNVTAPPSNWSWTCGEVTVCSLHADVPPSPSEYFLTLENFGAVNTTIDWSLSLVVAYIPVQNS